MKKPSGKQLILMATSLFLMGLSWLVDGAIEDDAMRDVAREEYQKLLEDKSKNS